MSNADDPNLPTPLAIIPLRYDSILGALPKRGRPIGAVILVAITLYICARCSFYSTFTGFQIFDDEGAMLLVLAGLARGHRLYDQLSAMYGPFGFYSKVVLIKALHLNVNHNVSRTITWIMTFAGCVIAGVATWRMTRQITGFILATFTTFYILLSIGGESGHPQDVCQLLIALSALIATFAGPKHFTKVCVALGVIGGMLMMTKGNLGVFYLAAFGLTLAVTLETGRPRHVLVPLCAVGLLSLPYILLREGLYIIVILQFFVMIECTSITCLALICARTKSERLTLRDALASLGSFAVTSAGIFLLTMVLGTSLQGMVEGLIYLPLRASRLLLHVWRLTDWMIPTGLISCALAVVVYAQLRRRHRAYPGLAAGLALVKIGLGLVSIMKVLFGDMDGQDFVLAVTFPFMWLVLIPVDDDDRDSPPSFDRIFIVLLSITEILGSYPNAGAQQSIGEILPLCLMVVCVFDGLRWATRQLRDESIELIRLIVCGVLVALVLGWAVTTDYIDAKIYQELPALSLSGSNLIHLNADQLTEFRNVTQTLQTNCDRFMTVPGMNSFYFWTNMLPPTDTNTTNWMVLTRQEQEANYKALQSARRPCILYNHRIALFWNNSRPSAMNAPIIQWIDADYCVAMKQANWLFLVPKDNKSPPSRGRERFTPPTTPPTGSLTGPATTPATGTIIEPSLDRVD